MGFINLLTFKSGWRRKSMVFQTAGTSIYHQAHHYSRKDPILAFSYFFLNSPTPKPWIYPKPKSQIILFCILHTGYTGRPVHFWFPTKNSPIQQLLSMDLLNKCRKKKSHKIRLVTWILQLTTVITYARNSRFH